MSAIVQYVREAWPTASATVEDTLRKTYEVVVDGVVLGRPTWLSRRVDDWSWHTFPPATAKVVAAAIVALPFVALVFLTPPVLSLLVCTVLFLGRQGTDRERRALRVVGEYDSLNYNMFTNSMASINIVTGIGSIMGRTIRKVRLTFPVAICVILLGGVGFYCSHFLQDTVEAGKELYERLFRGANTHSLNHTETM